MKRDEQAEKELDALYAELPKLECRGLCHASCNGVSATRAEVARIAAHGRTIAIREPAGKTCDGLTAFGTCAVYAVRPMVCRIWGATDSLRCSYGCRPERYLTSDELFDFLLRSYEIGGHPDYTTADIRRLREFAAINPDARAASAEFIRTNASREVRNVYNLLQGIYGV